MSNHVKPTVEELQKGMDESLNKLDTLPEGEEDETPEEEVETPKEDEAPKGDETPKDEEEPKEEETPEEEKEEEPAKETPEEEPEEESKEYKKRYEDSSREAHILYSKSKKLTEVMDQAVEIPEPTEEQLTVEYPEWEIMSELEKKLARENYLNKLRFQKINEATKEFKDIDEWNKKVDEFVLDPETLIKYPKLEGKEEAFKVFVSMPTHRGVDFETLATSFLYAEGQKPPVKNKGKMFEVGTGGLNDKPKPRSNKITIAESALLRVTDYKKYLEYVKNGLIEDEVD